MRISLRVIRFGRLTANAITSAMSSAVIAIGPTNSSAGALGVRVGDVVGQLGGYRTGLDQR